MANSPIGMILSAGFGTRLHPLTLLRPKPAMELGGKPILYLLIRMLEKLGIKDIIINLHYLPEKIQKIVSDGDFKARIHFIYEKQILGTGGGIANALRILEVKNRPLVVFHGDIICDVDLEPFMDTKDFCTLICDKDREISGYRGSVGIDKRGNIVELGQFYHSDIDAVSRGFFTGIHILSPQAVEMIKQSQLSNLVGEIYPRWLREGGVIKGIVEPLFYEDLGTPMRLFQANMAVLKDLSQFRFVDIFPNQSAITIGTGSVIDRTAQLRGPLLIGPGAHIAKNVSLGPHVIVGSNATIGENAIVRNAVIMAETSIEKDEHIDCAIALRNARVLVKDQF